MIEIDAKKDLTRQELLLESALELFAEHGYAGTSVKAIAQRAGVSQGLLYVHFTNKEALLLALFEKSMHDVQSTFEIDASANGVARLEILLHKTFDLIQMNHDFWRLFYTLRFQPATTQTLGSIMYLGIEAIRTQLEQICRDLNVAHPELEARLLFATIDGICQHALLEPDAYPFERVLEVLLGKYQQVSL